MSNALRERRKRAASPSTRIIEENEKRERYQEDVSVKDITSTVPKPPQQAEKEVVQVSNVEDLEIWDQTDTEIQLRFIRNWIVSAEPSRAETVGATGLRHCLAFIWKHQIRAMLSKDPAIVEVEFSQLKSSGRIQVLTTSDVAGRASEIRRGVVASIAGASSSSGVAGVIYTAAMLTNDYQDSMSRVFNKENQVELGEKFLRCLTILGRPSSITRHELLNNSEINFTDAEIDVLIALGALHIRVAIGNFQARSESTLYWVSHPLLAQSWATLRRVESAVLAMIRRTRFQEITDRDLRLAFHFHAATSAAVAAAIRAGEDPTGRTAVAQQTAPRNGGGFHTQAAQNNPLPPLVIPAYARLSGGVIRTSKSKKATISSELPCEFHILDLVGRGVITQVDAPSGPVYRLP